MNFIPLGIFTRMTGSVSVFTSFAQVVHAARDGGFDLEVYTRNLDLVERAIQDRLREEDGETYRGAAQAVAL